MMPLCTPNDTPLTVSELQGMLKRHAENMPVKKVIEQALSRRLREEVISVPQYPAA